MKKMLLLTLVLLALGVSLASAQGTISLAYNECRIATSTGNDFQWGTQPCEDPANGFTSATMVAAFKNSVAMTNFALATSKLDILVGNGTTLPSFWDFSAGTCHEGGMSSKGSFGAPDNAPALPANCGQAFGASTIQNNSFGSISSPSTGRVHWEGDHGRNTPQATLAVPAATGGYCANIIALSWDDANFSGATCAGCNTPACIVLNQVDLFNSNGQLTVHMDTAASGIQNYVTFYGGAAGCPGAVPTRNATWGQVKALYR